MLLQLKVKDALLELGAEDEAHVTLAHQLVALVLFLARQSSA